MSFDPSRALQAMASMQPEEIEGHLRDKLIRALQKADQGQMSLEQLEQALSQELEIVRSHYEAAPERDQWGPYLQGLQCYFTALEQLVDSLQNTGGINADVCAEALELAYEADQLFRKQEKGVTLEIEDGDQY